MGLLGIFHFMVVNGMMAWNMSTGMGNKQFKHENWKFCITLAEQLVAFQDILSVDIFAEAQLNHQSMITAGHQQKEIPHGFLILCCVCKFEDGICHLYDWKSRRIGRNNEYSHERN